MLKHFKSIKGMFLHRKRISEPDLRIWEFVFQMLVSGYLSWRWLGAEFKFWSLQYWVWLAHYSSLKELGIRANLASDRTQERKKHLK